MTNKKVKEAAADDEKVTGTSTGGKSDLAAFRLNQNFSEMAGVKQVVVAIPIRRPHKHHFVRVRPGEEHQIEVMLLETEGDRESYLIRPEIYSSLPEGIAVPKVLRMVITRQGVLSLWPIKLPDESGKLDAWNASAHVAAKLAETNWLRIVSNRHLGAYNTLVATADIPEPEWPDLSLMQILEIAFRGKLIETSDHLVLRQLRGEV